MYVKGMGPDPKENESTNVKTKANSNAAVVCAEIPADWHAPLSACSLDRETHARLSQ